MPDSRFPSLVEQIETVKGALDRLPSQLADARRSLSDRRKDVETVASNVKDLEAETLMVVSAEITEGGKTAFSNKEAREAEVRNRLRLNDTYRLFKRQLDEVETAKLNAELQLNKLQDEERAMDRMLDAVGHQVRAESIRELTKSVLELTALEAKRMGAS